MNKPKIARVIGCAVAAAALVAGCAGSPSSQPDAKQSRAKVDPYPVEQARANLAAAVDRLDTYRQGVYVTQLVVDDPDDGTGELFYLLKTTLMIDQALDRMKFGIDGSGVTMRGRALGDQIYVTAEADGEPPLGCWFAGDIGEMNDAVGIPYAFDTHADPPALALLKTAEVTSWTKPGSGYSDFSVDLAGFETIAATFPKVALTDFNAVADANDISAVVHMRGALIEWVEIDLLSIIAELRLANVSLPEGFSELALAKPQALIYLDVLPTGFMVKKPSPVCDEGELGDLDLDA